MVTAAKITSPSPTPVSNTRVSNTSAPQASSASTAAPGSQDTYEPANGTPAGANGNAPAQTPAADSNLRAEVKANAVQAHVAPPGEMRTVSSQISDPGDLSSAGVRPAQTAFRNEMREALGARVSNPPRRSQLRQYFRTLRGKPGEAVQAYERYADAYGRHDGEHNYRSVDRTYVRDQDSKILSGRREGQRELNRGNNVTAYEANAPDNFREATRDRGRDRRSNMDCEGFAMTAQTLLGEAGLNTSSVVGAVTDTEGHAVAIARDPNSDDSWVLSNGDAYPVQGSLRSTLDSAFGDTTLSSLPSSYYEASNLDLAATRRHVNSSDGRID